MYRQKMVREALCCCKNTTGAMRGSIVEVTCGERTYSYAIMQYDVVDLLGTYQGQYISLLDQQTYGLSML